MGCEDSFGILFNSNVYLRCALADLNSIAKILVYEKPSALVISAPAGGTTVHTPSFKPSKHYMQRVIVIIVLLCLCTMPILLDAGRAQAYNWRGFERFGGICKDLGIQCDFAPLDLAHTEDLQGIVFIGPQNHLPLQALQAFADHGGNLLIFDDFGHSYAFFRALSWDLVPAQNWQSHGEYLYINGNPELPVLQIHRVESLKSVTSLAFNHPQPARSQRFTPLVGSHEAGFIFDEAWREGRILFVADASMPINLMLESFDNKLLVKLLLTKTCANQSPCHLRILEGPFETLESLTWRENLRKQYNERREAVQLWWEQRKDQVLALPWFTMALGVGIFLLLAMILVLIPFKLPAFLHKDKG